MSKGLFITGTDTGVGKTIVSASLLRIFRRHGIDAAPMKPVQTGVKTEPILDLDVCLGSTDIRPDANSRKLMNPFQYNLPSSPHLAAEHEKQPYPSIKKIAESFGTLAEQHKFILVEGAGGILVPLSRKETVLSLAKELALPLLIVSRAGLGTLNHTLLTVDRILRENLEIAAIIPNTTAFDLDFEPEIIEDNWRTIAEMTGLTVWPALPFVTDQADDILRAKTLAGVIESKYPKELKTLLRFCKLK